MQATETGLAQTSAGVHRLSVGQQTSVPAHAVVVQSVLEPELLPEPPLDDEDTASLPRQVAMHWTWIGPVGVS